MGYSNWSDAVYRSRQFHRKQANKTAFTYDKEVRDTGKYGVHDDMNVLGKDRESRDSKLHPDSLAIGVIFDVTGSMGSVPRVMQTKLGALMRVLIENGYVAHPQILFGAVGDAYCDVVPLQIGQFESGLEMDDDLGKIFLEGGGGGQVFETYELALYYFAHHTQIDCFEKRREKGYLFTIGDEKPYPHVRSTHVAKLIGDRLQSNPSTADVIAELTKRYHYFHIVPTNTYHGKSAEVQQHWRDLIGERLLLLDDESAVCETIAMSIGLVQGTLLDLAMGVSDLERAGSPAAATRTAAAAVEKLAVQRRTLTAKLPTWPVNGR